MLLCGLFLQLWWLVLPLSILARPEPGRTYEKRAVSGDLGPTDSAHKSPDLEDWDSADVLDRRAIPAGNSILSQPVNADGQPLWMARLFAQENPLQPILRDVNNATDDLDPHLIGYGWYSTVGKAPFEEHEPFSLFFPPGDVPFGPRRGYYLTVQGWVDPEEDSVEAELWVLGHRREVCKGNLDEGANCEINLAVVKGLVVIWRADDDYVYLKADIHFPLRVHLNKTWRLFRLPHERIAIAPS